MNLASRHHCLARLCAVFTLVVLSIATPVTSAPVQQDAPETPAAQQYAEWPPRPALPPADAASAQPDTIEQPDNSIRCSSMMFGIELVSRAVYSRYTYAHGQWEWDLVTSSLCGDYYPYTPTTNTFFDEIFPKMSQDAAWVVYVSNQHHNDEIFKVRVEGGIPIQLTGNAAVDTQPVFSPDGSQIAFVSDRDANNPDVYIMSSNGGAPRRLTTTPGPDVEPDWSPDGKKIAWIRRVGSVGQLYVKNADGTGGESRLASLGYGSRPSWSPDGSQLAFEYDANGDGWLELGIVNADGTGLAQLSIQRISQTPGDLTMGSWYGGPGGKGLIFSELFYQYINSGWYITHTELCYQRLPGEKTCIAPHYIGYQYNFYPHARTWDRTPPVVRLFPIPQYSQYSAETLSAGLFYFTVRDPIESHYKPSDPPELTARVEKRVGTSDAWDVVANGMFLPPLGEEYQLRGVIGGQLGETVMYRVKALDAGLNASNPDDLEPITTKIYRWPAQAQVQDARGTPLHGAVIDAGPMAFDQPVETRGGPVDLYYFNYNPSDQEAKISKTGFGQLPNPKWPVGWESEFLAVLPPQDNLITNGYFEDPNGTFSGWQMEGAYDAAEIAGRYSEKAVQVGLKCFPAWCYPSPQEVPLSGGGFGSLEMDAQGGLHHLSGVNYFYRSPAGQWEKRASMNKNSNNNITLPIGVLPNGKPFTFYIGQYGTSYQYEFAYLTDSGAWAYDSFPGSAYDLVSDSQGQVHILYRDANTVNYRKRLADGQWQEPISIITLTGMGTSTGSIAVRSGGEVVIAIHQPYINYETISIYKISPTGDLSQAEAMSGFYTRVGEFVKVDLISGMEGNVYLYANAREKGYLWSSSSDGILSELPSEMSLNNMKRLELHKSQVDPNGALHLIHHVNYVTREYHSYDEYADLVFGPGEKDFLYHPFFSEGFIPGAAAVIDHSGLMHFVTPGSDSSFYYQKPLVFEQPAESSLVKSISLPANINNPTLSFFYRLDNATLNDQIDFKVRITPQGDSPVTVYEAAASPETSAWKHAWADLSPWKGKTVKISFAVEQMPSQNHANLYLDEITLGAWTTPIARAITPSQVDWPVGDGAWVEISGENLMDGAQVYFNDQPAAEVEWVSDNLVRCRLPAGMPYGLYTVRLENPGGVTADAPTHLVVGDAVFLPKVSK